MRSIKEFIGAEINWKQPNAFKMEYELRAGEEVIGTLNFRSSFGSMATAECVDGCWTFKRTGIFKPKVTIRVCDSENEIGVFNNNTWSGGGTLELTNGQKLMASTNFWQTNFEITTESGRSLIQYHHSGVVRLSSKVNILPAATGYPELPWLVMFGWYLAVLLNRDSGAAGA